LLDDYGSKTLKRNQGLTIALGVLGAAFLATGAIPVLHAQSCTTQSKLAADVSKSLSTTALELATAVKAGDASKIQVATIPEYAANFEPTAYLVRTTSEKLTDDTLSVTQIYELDALSRAAGTTTDAEFTCALVGTAAETDFNISALPAGLYGFVMVEAKGPQPWLLSFLLRQQAGTWKMAGFYPRARSAAGHDGLWYWTNARADAKAKQLWPAWLLYGEADQLLRPANFATSTNLDKLRAEQRAVLPPDLPEGIGPDAPLVLKDGSAEDHFTSVDAEGSEDGKRLNLMLHLRADSIADPAAARSRNDAAAKAFLNAHKELRPVFDGVWVFAESPGQNPFATEQKIQDIP
jgi:hypothetical protein